ncbi:hypothetical protein [Caulobacter zeae]|nr:hypothetical protein [Caulobacter zeae]
MKSMMKRAAGLLLVAAALALTGCKPPALKADPAAEAVARAVYDDVAAGRVEAVRARMTPEAKASASPEQIQALRPFARTAGTVERRLINMQTVFNGAGQAAVLVYELPFPNGAVLYEVRMERTGANAPWRLLGLTLNRASNAELAKGSLTMTDRSPGQLAFLAATVLSPLLMLSAIVAAVMAPGLKRKWLWALLALAGVGAASMNWTTGQAGFQVLSVNLIGAGISKMGFSNFYAWILKFTLPVGAVIVHVVAWKARQAAKAKAAAPDLDQGG